LILDITVKIPKVVAMSTTEPAPAIEPMMTSRQVCDVFGITQQTLRRWTERGQLPVLVVNPRVYRYRQQDVQALIDGHTASPDAGNGGR
jgi:hypothetical protein